MTDSERPAERAEQVVPPQPTLRDGDLVLRAWTSDDAERARLQHDEIIARSFGFDAVIPSAEQQLGAIERWAEEYRNDRRTVSFLVELGGRVAGTVEVRQKGDAVGELSWAVFPDHRGQRVATRAVRMLVDYCFTELGLDRVEARVEPDNLASLRTAGRAGLRREGVMRRVGTTGGVRRDYVLLARLADDLPPNVREGFTGVLNSALPMKRVIAQGVIRNTAGEVLLCELTYKPEWDLPGGVVDRLESPAGGLVREVREELGLELAVRSLIVVNWLAPWRGWDDACQFVFDLGTHDAQVAADLVLEPREIAAVHWCSLGEARERVAPYLATLLDRVMGGPSPTLYLERGQPPSVDQ